MSACDNSPPLSPLIHLPTSIALELFPFDNLKYIYIYIYLYFIPIQSKSSIIRVRESSLRVDTIAAKWCGQQLRNEFLRPKIVETLHIWTFFSFSLSEFTPSQLEINNKVTLVAQLLRRSLYFPVSVISR
ncbi:hypothetical protein VN97_g1154 [Penicillium thymicola]|uniref:Uncharacterized protein n=1 Tax=Penicillium thymicola TaxID=293382 RepID=A0AAI9XCZ2_PENTH|nr:hypothetical protein VN97_g1154 [Penicillium thymicola]